MSRGFSVLIISMKYDKMKQIEKDDLFEKETRLDALVGKEGNHGVYGII